MRTDEDADVTADLLPLLRERRSTRSFDAEHVLGDADLVSLLEAARWAPSAGNSQPWAFLVSRRDDAAHRRFVPLLSRGDASWVPHASALVFTLHRTATGPEEDALTYSDYAAYDLGQAVAQLTVQALSLGLAVHQFAGFDHEGLAELAGVPPHWAVTTGVAIGRELPADVAADDLHSELHRERDRRPRARQPLADLAFGARFGDAADVIRTEVSRPRSV